MIFYGTKPASYVEKINNCCVAWSNLAEFWNIFNPKQIGEDCHNIVKVTKTTSTGSNLKMPLTVKLHESLFGVNTNYLNFQAKNQQLIYKCFFGTKIQMRHFW